MNFWTAAHSPILQNDNLRILKNQVTSNLAIATFSAISPTSIVFHVNFEVSQILPELQDIPDKWRNSAYLEISSRTN